MPGFIKVSGEQRPVAAPYVNVSGTWTPVALGYVKVNGEWKIWHSAEIEDDFNRPNSSELGIASNGFSEWVTVRGAWGVASNQATSATAASSYPAAATRLYKANTNYQVSVDIPSQSGLGVLAWVVDENNWFAAGSRREEVFYPSFYSCPNGGTLSGTRCIKETNLGEAFWNTPSSGGGFYTCPAGYTLNTFNNVCYQTTSATTTTEIVSGNRCTNVGSCDGNCWCGTTKYSWVPFTEERTVTSCGGCDGPYEDGVTCLCSVSATYIAPFTIQGFYSCPQGGSVVGTSCIRDDSYNATFNPARTEFEPRITIYQMSAGTVTIRANAALAFEPRSIRLETSINRLTARAFSATSGSGTSTSVFYDAQAATSKTTIVGIVKVPSAGAGNQGSNIDNFYAE